MLPCVSLYENISLRRRKACRSLWVLPSVFGSEVPDEGDSVAVRIGDSREAHVLVRRLDRSGRQTSCREVGDMPVQIVHGEVQQRATRTAGVVEQLDPAGLGDLPLGQTVHRTVVGWAAQ